MPRLKITLTDEMHDLLKAHAIRKDISMADLIRKVLTEYLVDEGEQLTQTIEWGGNRRPERETNDQ